MTNVMITLKLNNIFIASIIILLIFVSSYSSYSKDPYQNSILNKSAEGYVGFNLHIDSSIFNGYNDTSLSQTLFEIQDIGKCELLRDYGSIIISFTWHKEITHKGFYIFLKELEGPNDYLVQFTWDSSQGKSDLYINGIPLRTENEKYYFPWEGINYSYNNLKISEVNENVSGLEITNDYLTSNEIIKRVPITLIGKSYNTFLNKGNSSEDIELQKGKLLYSSNFTEEVEINNWILEGSGKIEIQDNQMIMQSEIPNPTDGFTGHFNLWCHIDFPDSIIIEWEFAPISDHGVCHLFFATKGKNGEEMFDSSLAKRDGHYRQYHS